MQSFIELESLGDFVAPSTKDHLALIDSRLNAIEQKLGEKIPEDDGWIAWIWKERNWFIPTAVAVMIAVLVAVAIPFSWHFLNIEFDHHIQTALEAGLAPIKDDSTDLRKQMSDMQGDIKEIRGKLSVLQAPQLLPRYSRLSPTELKTKKDELASLKEGLAKAPKETPNFWANTFETINLLSRAVTQLETIGRQPMVVFDDVRMEGMPQSRLDSKNVLLRNTIQGFVFTNSVIHFDSSVKLSNVSFQNCVFIFPENIQTPPETLQKIGQILLASDVSNVNFGRS